MLSEKKGGLEKSLISASLYIIAAILTGLGSTSMLIGISAVYVVLEYLLLSKLTKTELLSHAIVSIILRVLLAFALYKGGIFYRIYTSVYAEKPALGTGVGIVISLCLNMLLYLIVITIVLIKLRSIGRKKREE
ncbi:MAG: hypothetical protein ACI4QX_04850 [Lachnospiraceae bacterium]